MISRRGIIGGLIGLVAAPAIVRASSLMPISSKLLIDPVGIQGWGPTQVYRGGWSVMELIKQHHVKFMRGEYNNLDFETTEDFRNGLRHELGKKAMVMVESGLLIPFEESPFPVAVPVCDLGDFV